MLDKYQTFFNNYAQAINEQNFTEFKGCFKLPFILVHKEPKSVVSFNEELERKIKGFLLKLKEQGVFELKAKTNKVLNVADNMTFVSVSWDFLDADSELKETYTNSYILLEQELQIITLIVDDKHDLFSQLLK